MKYKETPLPHSCIHRKETGHSFPTLHSTFPPKVQQNNNPCRDPPKLQEDPDCLSVHWIKCLFEIITGYKHAMSKLFCIPLALKVLGYGQLSTSYSWTLTLKVFAALAAGHKSVWATDGQRTFGVLSIVLLKSRYNKLFLTLLKVSTSFFTQQKINETQITHAKTVLGALHQNMFSLND